MVYTLLVAALCVATAWGLGFPPVGHLPVHPVPVKVPLKGGFLKGGYGGFGGYGFPGYGAMGGGYVQPRVGQPGIQQPGYGQAPEVMTCIAKDYQDLNSQVRLTITPNRREGGYSPMGGGMFGGGMGGFDDGFGGGDDDFGRYEYRIDGTFVPSIALNKAGTYYVVITQFGRTADGCSADALGPIYSPQGGMMGQSPVGGFGMPGMGGLGGIPGGFGGIGGFGLGGMGFGGGIGYGGGFGGGYPGPYNSYGQSFYGGNQGGQQAPLGQLQNPAIVGASATIYSTHINGVSKNDLLGRGLALCRAVSNGRCQGQIPYCCTIQRDSLSAMEVFVDDDDDDDFDFPLGGGGNLIGVGPALGGGGALGGTPLGGAGAGAIAGGANTGGLF